MPETHPHIAIDFDNTITTEDAYPELGKPRAYAIETMNNMIKAGYSLAIWTSRGSEIANPIIMKQLKDWGLHTEKVIINDHFPYYLKMYGSQSPKIGADVYIDDKAYGVSYIDWKEISIKFLGYEKTFKMVMEHIDKDELGD